jgi:hypothetical protein
MESDEAVVALVSLATLIAGVVVIVVGLNYRARMRELRHKERLAMIEKGLIPPPEFAAAPPGSAPVNRSRSLGIIIVGLGFALMFLIGIAGGALDAGIGVGGAVAIVGAAFIVRSIYVGSSAAARPEPPAPPPSAGNSLLP